ncbi:vomeronasal type-2 receptor 26-like [Heteronotia binoei]|uniref:vomeronasal type-2 receptor 26-like n=1 Tax=Heteronotia binoei TaxID=13085 RepID=UPI00292FCFBF|nr:vomeronasal type-2 receptor 26-like [Heteronotia binoei]
MADNTNEKVCTGEEKLEMVPGSVFEMSMTSHSYSIYNAVYAAVHALDAMHLSHLKHEPRVLLNQLWQVLSKMSIADCNATSDAPSILHQYYQPGEHVIAAILSQIYIWFGEITFEKLPSNDNFDDLIYFSVSRTYQSSMEMVSTQGKFIPNYRCNTKHDLVAVIGGPQSETCVHMATILSAYKVPQLTYGCAPMLIHRDKAVFFYQTFPNEALQHVGILQLLIHFKWTWVGVISQNEINEYAEHFVQNVLPIFAQSGICFDFIERTPILSFSTQTDETEISITKIGSIIMRSSTNVVLVYGESDTMIVLRMLLDLSDFEGLSMKTKGKVWILTAQMAFTSLPIQRNRDIHFLHGAISFASHSKELLGFQKFLQMRSPTSEKEDGFILDFWQQTFNCLFPKTMADNTNEKVCTGEEKLETVPGSVFEMSMTGHSYSIYNAVYAVVHALDAMRLSHMKHEPRVLLNQLWQLHHFLRSISFNNSAGEKISFDKDGEIIAGYDIINWVTFPNQSFLQVKVGNIIPQTPTEEEFTIYEEAIVWPQTFQQMPPLSICNDKCSPGYGRREIEGKPFCCYDCLPCPLGKISNQKDTDECFQCPEGHYPSQEQKLCLPKVISFLSYEEPLGFSLSILVLSFSFITTLVLGIFIKNRNTPIVKANNRNLTYAILISLLLSFLCALLFIGQPQKVTCLLRQMAFGMIFSVAISCVLTKTITVIVAFKATIPGSRMRKWMGERVTTSIIVFCSVVQATICIVWLVTYPPFPDFDAYSVIGEIIVECNEGSVTMFYCILGYMGFLSIMSFTIAFLARHLPDSFNEAKFITFSMLVFCSVWLSFVPTYLSTKGKFMVAVEIFSILASSSGLLSFIFFPKCFIIVCRPDLNKREHLINRNK